MAGTTGKTVSMKIRSIPLRAATGAYVLHSGLEKQSADDERAKQLHGFAAGTYKTLENLEPPQFARLLSAGEITLGAALLAPFVSDRLAGAALAAFAGGLLGMYWKTPGLRKENSIWPAQAGIGISKDVWMLAIGLSLLVG